MNRKWYIDATLTCLTLHRTRCVNLLGCSPKSTERICNISLPSDNIPKSMVNTSSHNHGQRPSLLLLRAFLLSTALRGFYLQLLGGNNMMMDGWACYGDGGKRRHRVVGVGRGSCGGTSGQYPTWVEMDEKWPAGINFAFLSPVRMCLVRWRL